VLRILAMEGPTGGEAILREGVTILDDSLPDEDFEAEAARESPMLDTLGLPEPEGAAEPLQTTLSARMGTRLCGRLLLYEQGGAASIEDVFVRQECRGQGIARALVRHGQRLLRDRGYDRVTLQVLADNAAALGLYRSLGFRAIGEETRLQRVLEPEQAR
jgi:ribosomal protein S18 acetylase RimI-like enzyme